MLTIEQIIQFKTDGLDFPSFYFLLSILYKVFANLKLLPEIECNSFYPILNIVVNY